VDLRLADTGEMYVIEVNANCYLEKDSEFAMAAKADGLEYEELVSHIAELALERWKQRGKAQRKRKRARAAAT
jgi:D-alanine-D-alanine ligase